MTDDEPTVEAYNAETGDHVATGTVAEPDLSRWQRGYRRSKRLLINRPALWIMATAGMLLVIELV